MLHQVKWRHRFFDKLIYLLGLGQPVLRLITFLPQQLVLYDLQDMPRTLESLALKVDVGLLLLLLSVQHDRLNAFGLHVLEPDLIFLVSLLGDLPPEERVVSECLNNDQN